MVSRVKDTLESGRFNDEIIMVDNGSQDSTATGRLIIFVLELISEKISLLRIEMTNNPQGKP